jgi:hypothetical protein
MENTKMRMMDFHLTLSCQFGNRYRQVRFHLRPFKWQFGDASYRLSCGLGLFRMYAFGPFAVQWG